MAGNQDVDFANELGNEGHATIEICTEGLPNDEENTKVGSQQNMFEPPNERNIGTPESLSILLSHV